MHLIFEVARRSTERHTCILTPRGDVEVSGRNERRLFSVHIILTFRWNAVEAIINYANRISVKQKKVHTAHGMSQ